MSERVLLVRLKGKPFDVCIIQVYAPTCDHSNETVESFYEDVQKAMEQCKRHDVIIMMGDLNAKVGEGRLDDIVGPYGLGERNERGDRWVEWCVENKQVVLNTWFRHHPRKLWTWMSPGDRYRNQIDFITINKRFQNSVKNIRTYPGADCNSDHVPVVLDLNLKLKIIKKKQYKPKLNLQLLDDPGVQSSYRAHVQEQYETMMAGQQEIQDESEQMFHSLKTAIEKANDEFLPKIIREPKNPWMTDNILVLMDERRSYKGIDQDKYRDINRRIKREC